MPAAERPPYDPRRVSEGYRRSDTDPVGGEPSECHLSWDDILATDDLFDTEQPFDTDLSHHEASEPDLSQHQASDCGVSQLEVFDYEAGLATGETPAVPAPRGQRRRGAHSPNRGRRRGRGARSGKRHPLAVIVFAMVVVMALLGALLARWATGEIDPGGKEGPAVKVVIPSGASGSRIGAILAAAGVIHGDALWPYYVKLEGGAPLLPGTYRLARNMPFGAAVRALQRGPRLVQDKLVIPEGFTLSQIAARLASLPHMHFSAKKFMQASSTGAVRSPYEPPGVNNLEGLVFPATYIVTKGESETEILQELVGTFDYKAAELGLATGAAALHLTPYQVVTVASIVEREAKFDADKGPVASVLYNRLAANQPLGADSTLIYALRRTDPGLDPNTVNYNQPNPYNTRLHKGLPPTPIANPGIHSLQAAIHPPSTEYRYFVEVNPDGQLGFAKTPAGFLRLQAECKAAKLC